MLDIQKIRQEFPILQREVHGKPLVYLDNGASSQKPLSVINAIDSYYKTSHANVHRGAHYLSQHATDLFEEARRKVAEYIGANSTEEVLWTRGTTESINLVANSFGQLMQPGDEILISEMEHHSNIVPWQLLSKRSGVVLKVAKVNEDGSLNWDDFLNQLTTRTKLVSICHVSNTLGTVNPLKEIVKAAHDVGAKVLFDGAQAMPHFRPNMMDLDCDFYAFSAHKMYGPTGIGVLYGKKALLESMPPFLGGGEMISEVSFEESTWADLPYKFEAGTPNIADTVAMTQTIEFMMGLPLSEVAQHEQGLVEYCMQELLRLEGVRLIGTAAGKTGVVSFVVDGAHHYDLGTLLDQLGIAVRTGHHCTQPLMTKFGVTGTVRASFAVYNTKEEVDYFIKGMQRALRMLKD